MPQGPRRRHRWIQVVMDGGIPAERIGSLAQLKGGQRSTCSINGQGGIPQAQRRQLPGTNFGFFPRRLRHLPLRTGLAKRGRKSAAQLGRNGGKVGSNVDVHFSDHRWLTMTSKSANRSRAYNTRHDAFRRVPTHLPTHESSCPCIQSTTSRCRI